MVNGSAGVYRSVMQRANKTAWRKRRTISSTTTRAENERAARFRQRDAEYRAALGLPMGEPLPGRLGPAQPSLSPTRAISHV